ncbi:MAG: sporulation protein YqfD [Firmicutes bacterium]|nr:sporulation protein YqfD [Bacillota bacterium]
MAVLEQRGLWPGYLLISLQGPGVAKLLNLTVENRIFFWDLHYKEDTVTVKIRPRDFKRLRPLLKKTGCRVKILQKKGTLFILLQGWRRKGLLAGIILILLLPCLLSQFVWQIDIRGNNAVETKEISNILGNSGVHKGMLKNKVDLSGLERELLLELKELQWVGISLDGVRLDIRVVERQGEPPSPAAIDSLVAAKDGLVTNILVLSGEACVDVGDTVQKGQALIAGKITHAEEYNDEIVEEEIEVQPKGKVTALVWYESYAEAPLYRVLKRKTGRCSRFYALRLKEQEFPLGGTRESPYRNYELEKIKRHFVWRNLYLPVELLNNNYWEFEVETQPISSRDALQQAKNEALQKIEALLSKEAVIKKRTAGEYYFHELGTVGCRLMIEALEDIAVPQIPADKGREFIS